MFQLNKIEADSLRSQFVTLKPSGRGQHRKYLPNAFTEQGVAMLSSVLNSNRAIQVNIAIDSISFPRRVIIVGNDGVLDAERRYFTTNVLDVSFAIELGRVDTDDL